MDMSYNGIREAIRILDQIVEREDVPKDVKMQILKVKRNLYNTIDELVWTRSKAHEVLKLVEEMAGALGIAPVKTKSLENALYVEASLIYDKDKAKVRVEKVV